MRPGPEGTPPWSKGSQLIAPRDEVGQYTGPRDVISLPGDVGRSIDSILGQSGLANAQDHARALRVTLKSMTFRHPPRPPGSRCGRIRVCAVSAFSRTPGSGGRERVRPRAVRGKPMGDQLEPHTARDSGATIPGSSRTGKVQLRSCAGGAGISLQDVEICRIAAYAALVSCPANILPFRAPQKRQCRVAHLAKGLPLPAVCALPWRFCGAPFGRGCAGVWPGTLAQEGHSPFKQA
jgi:hypothetical protein